MKLKILTTALLFALTLLCHSQDIIILTNGNEIKSKVLEVLTDQVKYKKFDNLDGPAYSTAKSEIFMIKYQNGTKDIFSTSSNSNSNTNSSQTNEDSKKNEALKKLENYVQNKLNKQVTSLSKFTKTNGVSNNVLGQNIYKVMFDVEIEFNADGWLKGNDLEGYWRNNFYVYSQEPNLSAAGQQYMYATRLYPKGTLINLGCEAVLSNTDNGYEITEVAIKTTQYKGDVEKKRIMNFVNDEFNSGFPKLEVRSSSGNLVPLTKEQDGQQFYYISSIGESKYVTVTKTWQYKPLAKQTSFVINYSIYDRDFSSPNHDKNPKEVGKITVFLTAGSTNYTYTIKIPLANIRYKEFGLSEDFFYSDNTSWGGRTPSVGQFKLESNFNNKLNLMYSKGDLEIVCQYIDTNSVENVEKSYYINSFAKKGLLCKDKIRFIQSSNVDDILIGFTQYCDKEESRGYYMYYKGFLFYHAWIGNFLVIVKKNSNGITAISYDTEKHTKILEMSYK